MNMDPKLVLSAWELYQKGVLISNIANHCNKHRSTISRWLSGIKKEGLNDYVNLYNTAKNVERPNKQINQYTKELIYHIKKNNPSISGYKIRILLKKHYRIHISTSKVYQILKKQG